MKAEVSIESNAAEIKAAKDAAIERALEAIGLQAEGNVAMLAPVDTGRLRGSITHEVEGDTVYIGTNVEYAPYVEYGTSKTKAQPFLKPGIQDHMSEYQSIADAYLKG